MYERVNLKRFVAALLDAIIVGIIGGIPIAIYTVLVGFESITNSLTESFGVGNTFGFGVTQEILNYTAISTVIGVVVGYVWFVYIPLKWNGQTIGKKLMNIKVIDEDGNNPNHKQHFLRSIQNWSGYVTLIAVVFGYLSLTLFDVLNTTIVNGIGLLAFISYLMVLFKTDGRGLHDMIAHTTVVAADVNPNQSFQEKAAQISDWAEVKDEQNSDSDDDDPWTYE